jgi:putative phosphoesterase
MKYLVISDLHIPERASEIPKRILEEAKRCDSIICAGDFTTKEVFEELKKANKNLMAVKGNCDRFALTEYIQFPEKGKRIGVIHSHQFGRGNINFLADFAKSQGLDILIFGHTHVPMIEKRNGILLVNPGSANGIESGWGNFAEKTYAILDIEGGVEAHAIIRKID